MTEPTQTVRGIAFPLVGPGDRIRFSLECLAELRSGGDRTVVLEVDSVHVDEAGVKILGLRRVDSLR